MTNFINNHFYLDIKIKLALARECVLMKKEIYLKLSNKLNKLEDVDKLSKITKYSRDLLFVLYTQKIVRQATRSFYRIKSKSRFLNEEWRKGKSIVEISQNINFPPVLTGLIILHEEGISRKKYRSYLNNLNEVENPRLRKELKQVTNADIIYSPEGNTLQEERGKRGEARISKWLTDQGIAFRSEKDISNQFSKTPDFLLDNSLNFRGTDVHWIESKATFGDEREVKRNLVKQLIPYREMFGSGMVIYWYGFLNPQPIPEGILIETGKVLKDWQE